MNVNAYLDSSSFALTATYCTAASSIALSLCSGLKFAKKEIFAGSAMFLVAGMQAVGVPAIHNIALDKQQDEKAAQVSSTETYVCNYNECAAPVLIINEPVCNYNECTSPILIPNQP